MSCGEPTEEQCGICSGPCHSECLIGCQCGVSVCSWCLLHPGQYAHQCGYLLGSQSCEICEKKGGQGCQFSTPMIPDDSSSDSGSSSEESSSESETDLEGELAIADQEHDEAVEEAESARQGVKQVQMADERPEFPLPGSGLIRHKKWNTVHLIAEENLEEADWFASGRVICGRATSQQTHVREPCADWPSVISPPCRDCFRIAAAAAAKA